MRWKHPFPPRRGRPLRTHGAQRYARNPNQYPAVRQRALDAENTTRKSSVASRSRSSSASREAPEIPPGGGRARAARITRRTPTRSSAISSTRFSSGSPPASASRAMSARVASARRIRYQQPAGKGTLSWGYPAGGTGALYREEDFGLRRY